MKACLIKMSVFNWNFYPSNELSFAHTVENMLNSYSVPVDKQVK